MDAKVAEALKPLARIANAYENSMLDEHRPEWGDKDIGEIVLIEGRGGGTLLTLADAYRAAVALSMADGPTNAQRETANLVAENDRLRARVDELLTAMNAECDRRRAAERAAQGFAA